MGEQSLQFYASSHAQIGGRLKKTVPLEGMVRNDDTPVHKAIREAVVNMMIHSDYLITGVLKILKTDSGFVFSNPGSLKLPIRDIYEGGNSVARNPRIQTLFRMIGFGDNIGSGFPTILNAWGEENWRKPDLSQSEELHQVELKLWMISLMPQESTEHLQKLFGDIYMKQNKEAQIVLGTAFLEGGVTNARMQSILNLHGVEIGHILLMLVEQNMLIVDRKGRWTNYRLNEGFQYQPEQISMAELSKGKMQLKNNTDQKIYNYIRENGFITTHQVIEITSITSMAGASIAINRLIKRGLVEKKRRGKTFYYQLTQK